MFGAFGMFRMFGRFGGQGAQNVPPTESPGYKRYEQMQTDISDLKDMFGKLRYPHNIPRSRPKVKPGSIATIIALFVIIAVTLYVTQVWSNPPVHW